MRQKGRPKGKKRQGYRMVINKRRMGKNEDEVRVVSVLRENGSVKNVKVLAGPFEIGFAKKEGKVVKSSVISLGGNTIPDYLWRPAVRRARGILFS